MASLLLFSTPATQLGCFASLLLFSRRSRGFREETGRVAIRQPLSVRQVSNPLSSLYTWVVDCQLRDPNMEADSSNFLLPSTPEQQSLDEELTGGVSWKLEGWLKKVSNSSQRYYVITHPLLSDTSCERIVAPPLCFRISVTRLSSLYGSMANAIVASFEVRGHASTFCSSTNWQNFYGPVPPWFNVRWRSGREESPRLCETRTRNGLGGQTQRGGIH
ncbi:hypothetical protein PM082_004326 [Marasmius tenuissimus]|nr:hypothetical protein PM082_004326 [Marasmius tenuissimus]